MNDPRLFTLETRGAGDSVRVVASGEIDMAAEDAVVDAVAAGLAAFGGAELVLDLTMVSFIDSSGLRAVLRARDCAASRDTRLVVVAVAGGPVARLFEVAGVADRLRYE